MKTARLIARKLTASRKTLATAESCTGGLIAHTLTNIPGSSAFFQCGFITYANAAKIRLLKVPQSLIQTHGAVSLPVVQAMAKGLLKITDCDYAITSTGIAGPTGGTPLKPVGLVFIAVAKRKKIVTRRFLFKGTRLQIKTRAAQAALNLLQEIL